MASMSEFEENLWVEVVREHGPGLARPEPSREKHGWWTRPRLLAGTTVGLAAMGTTAALLLGATASPPAFAVIRNPNGTVTVKLIKVSGIAGANSELASMGVRAKIMKAMTQADDVAKLLPCQGQPAGTVRTVTLDPARIPRHQVLVLATDRAAHLGYYAAAPELRVAHRTAADRGRDQTALERALTQRARGLAASSPSTGKHPLLRVYCGRNPSAP
jgi:hypothetical protein